LKILGEDSDEIEAGGGLDIWKDVPDEAPESDEQN
jgi:hypothetical protein